MDQQIIPHQNNPMPRSSTVPRRPSKIIITVIGLVLLVLNLIWIFIRPFGFNVLSYNFVNWLVDLAAIIMLFLGLLMMVVRLIRHQVVGNGYRLIIWAVIIFGLPMLLMLLGLPNAFAKYYGHFTCRGDFTKWEQTCSDQSWTCVKQYNDANKLCSNSNECQGDCVYDDENQPAHCQGEELFCGCWVRVEEATFIDGKPLITCFEPNLPL